MGVRRCISDTNAIIAWCLGNWIHNSCKYNNSYSNSGLVYERLEIFALGFTYNIQKSGSNTPTGQVPDGLFESFSLNF